VTLADLRRGRGQARRVVVICAPEAALTAALQGACEAASELSASDFLVVPLIATGDAKRPTLSPPSLDKLQALAAASASPLAKASAGAAKATASGSVVSKQTQPPLPWDEAMPDVAEGWPIALPQSGPWADALAPELEQAAKQDAAVMARGLTIVLKKNGRVGTRRLGMPDWGALLADVEGRRRAGLDVVNI